MSRSARGQATTRRSAPSRDIAGHPRRRWCRTCRCRTSPPRAGVRLRSRASSEAGTRVACISWAPDANATWDTHGNNFVKLRTELLPQLDAAVGTLLADLEARGMLERTLVVVMGEFGRTPRVNPAAGRDHWNFCYGLLLAGGGVRGGYVHGASDRIGAHPSSNSVTRADVMATSYHRTGIRADVVL